MVDFDLIKGRIQKHKLSSIIHFTLERLNEIQRQNNIKYPFWKLLTLIKWSYIYTSDSILRSRIKEHEYNQLLALIEQFETGYRGINFKSTSNVYKSFKIMNYQQFPLQDEFYFSIFSRQVILYTDLHSKFDISKEFKQITGIDIISFLKYTCFTISFLNNYVTLSSNRYEGELSKDFIYSFQVNWGEEELVKYLNLLTVKKREDFETLQKLNNELLQTYETSFFTLKPFILFHNQYKVLHKKVFTQTAKHFIYNYLKENSSQFSEELGKRFEKYVELGLVENKIPFQNEASLISKYSTGKVTDFLVESDVLIEVKAIELHPRSGILRTKDILIKELNETIVKAYIQMLETARRINPDQQYYGIIVTYKEMYLGFGADAWLEFLKEPIEDYCLKTSIDLSILPPENLCFVSIEDWDKMMQIIKDKKATLKEIILKGIEQNASENIFDKLGMMEQVINKFFQPNKFTISYLTNGALDI